ncbi:MAG: ComEC/Rec2 family competence protein [Muribaculaceae bacterium]|nr:ComEC/Rec2 family competence protein [Muribaculaceae bacterium]
MNFIHRIPLLPVLAILIVVILTARWAGWSTNEFPSDLKGVKATYQAVVKEVSSHDKGKRLIVEISGVANNNDIEEIHHFKALLYLFEFENILTPYDIIEVTTTLEPITSKVCSPFESDFSNYYFFKGLSARGFVSPTDYKITDHQTGIRSSLNHLSQNLGKILDESSLSAECSAFIKATLLGDADNLSAQDRKTFSETGLAHILALSGTHVAIISSFVFFLFLPLGGFVNRKLIYILVLLVLWGYAIMTGLTPSVVRAVIMISVLFVGKILSRPTSSLNSLCLAALLILCFDPASLFSQSFQLSFCAVAAILIFGSHFSELSRKSKLRWLRGILSLSICAMIGTGLLSAYYFHTFPIYFLPANIPVAFLMPVLLGNGLFILILGGLGISFSWLNSMTDLIYNIIMNIARRISELPNSVIDDIYFPVITFVPFILSLVFLSLYLKRGRSYRLLLSMGFVIITFLFIINGNGHNIDNLIYCGGSSNGTDLIVKEGSQLYVMTTVPTESEKEAIERIESSHYDLIKRNRIEEVGYIQDGISTEKIERSGRMLWIGNVSIAFLTNKSDTHGNLPEGRADYGLITKTFDTSGLAEAVVKLNIDTVLLPREIHGTNLLKLIEDLKENSIPYYSLRESSLLIHIKPK